MERASAERRLRDALVAYTHPHVLVVDEVGYLSYGPDAANVLYHVVNARHLRRRAMVFTTNKSLRSWGKVLHDQDLADAIVERILERGRLITLDGPSMRTRHLEPGDIEPEEELQPAIISGIDRPKFPEPAGMAVLATTGLLWTVLLRAQSSSREWPRPLSALAIALAWLVGTAAIFGTVGFIQTWYLLVPYQAFALLVGSLAQTLADAVAIGPGRISRMCAALGLAGLLWWIAMQVQVSPLFSYPDGWRRATQIADAYLAELAERIVESPPGAIIGHPRPPMLMRVEAKERSEGPITVLTNYSVQAWVDLVYPDRQFVVLPRSPAAPPLALRRTTTVIDLDPRYGRKVPSDERGRRLRALGDSRRLREIRDELRQELERDRAEIGPAKDTAEEPP